MCCDCTYYGSTYQVGSGVLHLGQHVHSALPITEGERLNLVVWMRSARWRREHGCPMCDRADGLFPVEGEINSQLRRRGV